MTDDHLGDDEELDPQFSSWLLEAVMEAQEVFGLSVEDAMAVTDIYIAMHGTGNPNEPKQG